MAHHFSMTPETFVFLKVRRELTHRQKAMCHEHQRNQSNDRCDDTRVTLTENKLPFEHPRHPPHGVLANKDGGDKSHVAPHEQAKK